MHPNTNTHHNDTFTSAVIGLLLPHSPLLYASAPLREAVRQPGNAAAAATAPQAIVDGLRHAALGSTEDKSAVLKGLAHVTMWQCGTNAQHPSLLPLRFGELFRMAALVLDDPLTGVG